MIVFFVCLAGLSGSLIRDSPYFSAANYGRCCACGQLNPSAPIAAVHPATPGCAPYATSVGPNVSAFYVVYFVLFVCSSYQNTRAIPKVSFQKILIVGVLAKTDN